MIAIVVGTSRASGVGRGARKGIFDGTHIRHFEGALKGHGVLQFQPGNEGLYFNDNLYVSYRLYI